MRKLKKSIFSYFSDFGEIVWFEGHENLSRKVITQPTSWVHRPHRAGIKTFCSQPRREMSKVYDMYKDRFVWVSTMHVVWVSVFCFCSCTLSNAWWGCYLLVSWVALCANSRQQLAAVRSQQEERESTQLWKTLSRFYKLDLADGVDGGSGQARRRLRGKLAFVDHLSGMTTMVVPWQRAIREGTLRKISKHYLL